jgi:hypothetical protein
MRFFVAGTATADFADNAFNFAVSPASGDKSMMVPPSPVVRAGQEVASGFPASAVVTSPMGGQAALPAAQSNPVTTQAASTIRIFNDGSGDLEISFDGEHVHGVVLGTDKVLEYRRRMETGIAVRGVSSATPAFRIEAW